MNQDVSINSQTIDAEDTAERDFCGMSATYSPEDNKLRLYSVPRLDATTYARVKEAGFKWAPKQEFFVAPMWTPARADLLIELCGEIGDEDTSLVDRAEQRAERFGDYYESRATDAERAYDHVLSIGARFEGGQPILVGHHSEKRARKDKEKMDNGMRKAVTMWERAEYWSYRAEAALNHAKYKERADVRARRIKGLEADARKYQREITQAEKFTTLWQADDLSLARAVAIANHDHISGSFSLANYPREAPASQYEGPMGIWSALDGEVINHEQAQRIAVACHAGTIRHYGRWLAHTQNRIVYERAMLAEDGGLAGEKFNYEIGGRVLVRGEWLTVLRVNKRDGQVCSVTTNCRYVSVRTLDEIKDYRAPAPEAVAAVAAANKKPTICNYPGEGFEHVTQAQWDRTYKDYKGTREADAGAVSTGWGRVDIPAQVQPKYQRHRVRMMMLKGGYAPVFITDRKRVDPAPVVSDVLAVAPAIEQPKRESERPIYTPKEPTKFDELKTALRQGGVKTITAPQLFPTPPELAERMAQAADLAPGLRVLEPSAGTLRICAAIARVVTISEIELSTVEINQNLAQIARVSYPDAQHVCADFLVIDGEQLGAFDRVLVNPPFVDAADIQHIEKAFSLLVSGGRLVAICANGPRQERALKPMVEGFGGSWEILPADTFKPSGTSVNTVLIVVDKP
jgi:protein-L-isoaspartate O-methyltransferase